MTELNRQSREYESLIKQLQSLPMPITEEEFKLAQELNSSADLPEAKQKARDLRFSAEDLKRAREL